MTSTAAGEPTRPDADGLDARGDYRERLFPAPWICLAGALFAGLVSLVATPFGPVAAVSTAVVASVLIISLLFAWSPVIAVRDGELIAGRAHVPVDLVGEVTPLDAAAMRHALGPGLDVRAYIFIRGWIASGLRAELTDPDDPTPYWLLSTRRPDALVAALGRARAAGDPNR
jgi:hypothetical protein